jgi:hypothetical protein
MEEPDNDDITVRGRQILAKGAHKLAHNVLNYIGLGSPENSQL